MNDAAEILLARVDAKVGLGSLVDTALSDLIDEHCSVLVEKFKKMRRVMNLTNLSF